MSPNFDIQIFSSFFWLLKFQYLQILNVTTLSALGLRELLHQTLDNMKSKSILRPYNWFGIGLCCLMVIERLLLLNWNDLHSSWPYMKTEYQNFIILTIKSSWGHSIISFNLMASATGTKLNNSEWSLCTLNFKPKGSST